MNFLFKKIEVWFLILVIFVGLISLILFGGILLHEIKGGIRFPKIQKTALFFAEIPSNLFRIIKTYTDPMHQVKVIRVNDFKGKSDLNLYRKVERDYILLLSRFDGDLNESVVEAYDLKNFEIIHKWNLNLDEILKKIDFKESLEFKDLKDRDQTNFAMRAPFVDSQGNLLFSSNSPLIKVDFCGNLLWINQEDNFHHSIEEDHENNIWTGSYIFPYKFKFSPKESNIEFMDDGIAKISVKSGETLFNKSLAQIFYENGYLSEILGKLNYYSSDPIHLNDIQPVLSDGKYWKKGDLFLSLRNLSMIIQYRPENNKILKMISGPFINQHDVDIISENEIGIFNNNAYNTVRGRLQYDQHELYDNSNIIIYNFENNKFVEKYPDILNDYKIKTETQGLFEILPDKSMLIEEQNRGRLVFLSENAQLEWEYVNKNSKGEILGLNWSRIIHNKNKVDLIRENSKKGCND